jgi:hypothetical protein
MGQTIPAFDGYSSMPTSGPGRGTDHTDQIKRAVLYLKYLGGGTLYFPCTPNNLPPNQGGGPDGQSIYNIRDTITVPTDVSLVGESAEEGVGRCRIYWRDVEWASPTPIPSPSPGENPNCHDNTHPVQPHPGNLLGKAMFQLTGGDKNEGTYRVRFKDLWLYSRSSGEHCDPRYDYARIAEEDTVGIGLYADTGNIRDVILENVSISSFTYGIRATSCADRLEFDECSETDNEISGVRMRGVRPSLNHRQLYINARYAYDWDVQNFNIPSMLATQGAVHIVKSGRPESPVSENTNIKFLELNCNAQPEASFCAKIEKHGGLYFKLTHHEGIREAFQVEDMGFYQNADPIVLEGGVATGIFKDASMKLYMIGNGAMAAPGPDETRWGGRMEFKDAGVQADVFDCGDIFGDRTDVIPSTPPDWGDWQMGLTHTERNRIAFFATVDDEPVYKTHTPCPKNVGNATDIDKVGGEFFDTGVMPTELYYDTNGPDTPGGLLPAYTHYVGLSGPSICGGILPSVNITSALEAALFDGTSVERGAVYIDGCVDITHTITIPTGKQIIGGPNVQINYLDTSGPLFKINAPIGTSLLPRTTGIVLRNLKMVGTGDTNGIEI